MFSSGKPKHLDLPKVPPKDKYFTNPIKFQCLVTFYRKNAAKKIIPTHLYLGFSIR